MSIIETILDSGNEKVVLTCLILAVLRIYLEIIQFDFSKLPMTKSLGASYGADRLQHFHRVGLFLSIGYILFFAPSFLLT